MSNATMVRRLLAGSALAALSACTTLPVTSDSNPNLAASNCHTFAFLQEHVANVDQPAAFGNPMNAERLRIAVESNLAAKGIQRVADRAAAECTVGYAMGTRQVIDQFYSGLGFGWGYGWGYGWGSRGFGGALGYDGPFVRNETRIAVDLFDAKSRAPIWHGAVSQNFSELTGPNAATKINAAAAAIFAKFPGSASLPSAAPAPAANHGAT